jgi:DNA-binding response OmpR family regulator
LEERTAAGFSARYDESRDSPMTNAEGPRATIQLVEDDPALAAMLVDRLGAKGYCVWHAVNAAEAEQMLGEVQPDLIIVDLMLPDKHGLVLCANFHEVWNGPIIICTASKRPEDLVLGFKLGADDYIGKPFSMDELEARIDVALRRSSSRPSARMASDDGTQRIGELVIDKVRCRAVLGSDVVRLTPTEYRLLCALADRPNEVVSREELAQQVWGYHDPDVSRSLDVHMRRLRTKLGAGTVPAPTILTVRGFGYQMAQEPEGVAVADQQA